MPPPSPSSARDLRTRARWATAGGFFSFSAYSDSHHREMTDLPNFSAIKNVISHSNSADGCKHRLCAAPVGEAPSAEVPSSRAGSFGHIAGLWLPK